MTTAIYPGSFDPITNGHIDLLQRASKMFDKVIIAVSFNGEKKGFLPINERIKLIKESVKNIQNVQVDSYEGLTVDYAKNNGINILIRGIRTFSDLEYEAQLANINASIYKEIETVFLIPKPKYSFISSSSIREILKNNGDISPFVPKAVCDYFKS